MTITTEKVTSKDGTQIGYTRLGTGPALVLVQGAMGTAYNFKELAEALADTFTVITPDRRGRGMSPRPFYDSYTINDDVDDLAAVLESTDARLIYGLSSGGDIVLRAALTLPQIERIALFEPAIFVDGFPHDSADRFKLYAANKDVPGMLVSGMKAGKQGPAFLRALPDAVVKPLVNAIINAEAKSGTGEYASMADLAHAFHYDLAVVQATQSVEEYAAIERPVLLLGGSRSPAYLGKALDALERTIPQTERVVINGVGHAASWNTDRQRNPDGGAQDVAVELKRFFTMK